MTFWLVVGLAVYLLIWLVGSTLMALSEVDNYPAKGFWSELPGCMLVCAFWPFLLLAIL